MSEPQTDRVIRLLNLLASDNAQERATAGEKLANMAREGEKTVAEFVRASLSFTAWTIGPPEPPQPLSSIRLDQRASAALLDDLEVAIHAGEPEVLTAWEREFADDILARRPTHITQRQARAITRAVDKLSR